jgi:hypothetical protein
MVARSKGYIFLKTNYMFIYRLGKEVSFFFLISLCSVKVEVVMDRIARLKVEFKE